MAGVVVGTCLGPDGEQEVSLEEMNRLGLPLFFFLGRVSLERRVQKGQGEWGIFQSVFWVLGEQFAHYWVISSQRKGLCRAQGKLGTPICSENPGNGDQVENFRRDPNGV